VSTDIIVSGSIRETRASLLIDLAWAGDISTEKPLSAVEYDRTTLPP
jgi:hypothetical protein